jgi:2-oxoglutarate ferredoxin oxidoreductase subunit alpha
MRGIQRVVVPEMNLGQYLREIERLAPDDVEVRGVCKMNTQLITPEEILTRGGLA